MSIHNPLSDAAATEIAARCDKKIYSTPFLRDLDTIDKTEGGTQPTAFESLNGALTS